MPEPAAPSAQPDTSTPPDLSTQLAALTEVTRQQGLLIQRLCERVAPPQSTVSRAPEPSAPPPTIPVAAPAAAISPPMIDPSASAPSSGEVSQMTEAEHERMTERFAHFHRFDPPTFDGSCTKPWVVKGWVSAMEKLFEDLFVPEREQVHLGVHCLSGDAHPWWRWVKRDQGLVALQMSWDEFCGMLFGMYFSNILKQKLEEDLKRIQ